MLNTFLLRACRVVLMLFILLVFAVPVTFIISPNINFFEAYVEKKVAKALQADQFDITTLKLGWDAGPVIYLGQLSLHTPTLTVEQSEAKIAILIYKLFIGDYAPELQLRSGRIAFDLDVETNQPFEPVYIGLDFDDMLVEWKFHGEVQRFEHVSVSVPSDYTAISFQSDGVSFYASLDDELKPTRVELKVDHFSGLPKSWLAYTENLKSFHFSLLKGKYQTWQWQTNIQALDGNILIPQAHIRIPFTLLKAEGHVDLQTGSKFQLEQLEASSIRWESESGFADIALKWQDDLLHIQAHEASFQTPLLWSWLWMLGEDSWHEWLNSMQKGRFQYVQGTLDLPWQKPLQGVPTSDNIEQMQYHVTAKALAADMALGLAGDYLYNVDAYVEVDQNHLTADILQAVLNDGIGDVRGDYNIDWDTLTMNVEAEGDVDVGKLHQWLDKDSAQIIHWGKAPATARLSMKWNLDHDEPTLTKVYLKPTKKGWILRPKDIPLHMHKGVAVWDFNRGLNLKNMQVKTPWFKGQLSMFLDKKEDWNLAELHLQASENLNKLTEQFSLPVVKPKGKTAINLNYQYGKWKGNLDFSKNTWLSFAGFPKQNTSALKVNITGQSAKLSLLPIQIKQLRSNHEDFSFDSSVLIDEARLDFKFTDVSTPSFYGDFRLLVPFDEKIAWGLEVQADYIEKGVIAKYLEADAQEVNQSSSSVRPWSVFVDSDWVAWDKSYAEAVHFQFSSNTESTGSLRTGTMLAGDVDLEQVDASFSMLEKGKFDLHVLEAEGSGQHVTISGSLLPQSSGVLKWQGLALMQGKFGTLMQQAELDQLFQEGEMTALFLGKGEFKEGEPWWRGMDGRFRLRVDDGRMMEGGTLTHLLAAISLVDIPKYIVLQRSDIVGKGLLYDQMQIEARFEEEKLIINQLAFKSSALDAGGHGEVDLEKGELDILLIARPWQNIEALVGNIPLLGYILAGKDKSFLRKVYRIHGPASDAAVDEMDPKDAGLPPSGLLENLFSLPSKWFGNQGED